MAQKNESLFSRLTKLFRSGPVIKTKVKGHTQPTASSSYELFRRNISDIYSTTVSAYGAFDRMSRYSDFSEMEATPELSSALDIYAEESASQDDSGKVLHVYSENRAIRELLEELFYDTLNVDFNLPMWARNLCKYGDFFAFLDVDPKYGVINALPIPIAEMEREEGYDPNDPMAVRFRWITKGNKVLENWQVVHFRLLGNDAFLPYGASVLESARRIWRQLILSEDAMLLYRVVRAPERRIFYIDVGNIPPEEIENFMQQAQTSLKRNMVIDKATGRVDLRFNPMSSLDDYYIPVRGGESGTKIETLAGGQNTAAVEDVQYIQKKLFAALKIPKAYLGYDEEIGCLVGDTLIPLLDGRNVTIQQLVEEHEAGVQNWVYSYDENGQPHPGKINKAWLTKRVNKLYKIKLDNGEIIRCTENHPFMLHNGTYVRADELKGGESLMALYRKNSSTKDRDFASGYEKVLNHFTKEWEYTHRFVARDVQIKIHESCNNEKYTVIHHETFDKKNNNPDKLIKMGKKSHATYHANIANNLLRVESRENLRNVMKTEEYKRSQSRGVQKAWDNDNGDRRSAVSNVNIKYRKIEKMHARLANLIESGVISRRREHNGNWKERPEIETIINCFQEDCYTVEMISKKLKCGVPAILEVLDRNNYTWEQFASKFDKIRRGRKIISLNLEEFKEIACSCKTRKEFLSKINLSRSGFEGYLTRSNVKPTDWYKENIGVSNHKVVEIIIEVVNDEAVYDLEIDRWSNFAVAAGVVLHNSKATLAQEDIRFSRTISRIQKVIISELNKIAMIHLYSHGFTDESLLNFKLMLNNPSSVAQLQKLELIKTKFDIAGAAPEGVVDRAWIRRNVLGLTDEDIERVKAGRKADKIEDNEVESAQPEGGEETGGGESSGGALGGEESALGGGEEAGGGEEENLFASYEPTGRGGAEMPVRPSNEVNSMWPKKKEDGTYEKERINKKKLRRTHNRNDSHMPNFGKTYTQNSLDRPYGDPMRGANLFEDDDLPVSLVDAMLGETNVSTAPRMTGEMENIFKTLSSKIGNKLSNGLLSEALDDSEGSEE